MIDFGGAGSSGLPAAVSGNAIISSANNPITTNPTTYSGCEKNCQDVILFATAAAHCNQCCCASARATSAAQNNPINDSPAISPDAVSTPEFSTRACWASL